MVPDWREGVSICRSARTATWTVNVNEGGEINKRRRSFHADGEKLREWQTVLWQDARPLLMAALSGRSGTRQGVSTLTLRQQKKYIKLTKKSLERRAVLFSGTYCCSIPTFMWVNSLWRRHGAQRIPMMLQEGFSLTAESEWPKMAESPKICQIFNLRQVLQ